MPIKGRPLIIAHRGASAEAPENTLPAFRRGIESGADGVEFDVRLSKDGVPVVIHDPDLKRVAGHDLVIARATAQELAVYQVPSLTEVLQLFTGNASVIHIELKVDRRREVRPLVSAVGDIVVSSPLLRQIVISSFRLEAIAEVKRVFREIRTSALFAPSIVRVIERRRHMISIARAAGADGISPHRSLITKKLVKTAADLGMPTTVWTCDKVKWLKRASDLGITAIITNDPSKFVAGASRFV